MTIFTRPLADKGKAAPAEVNELEKGLTVPAQAGHDGDAGDRALLFPPRAKRLTSASAIFILLPALCVIFLGIVGGAAIYRAYARNQLQRLRFHGYCGLPYENNEPIDDNNLLIMINNKFREMNEEANRIENGILKPWPWMSNELKNMLNETDVDDGGDIFFKQEVDLDLSDDQGFAKIDVPNFRDGREGRFMHDFKYNESAIIDNIAKSCFIMPLDRDVVMPPQSIADVIIKIWDGYYNIDTNIVRKNMRVILPELSEEEKDKISPRIRSECQESNIFRLEKYVSGVFKRSASFSNRGKFAEYAGRVVEEVDIVNIDHLVDYEAKNN